MEPYLACLHSNNNKIDATHYVVLTSDLLQYSYCIHTVKLAMMLCWQFGDLSAYQQVLTSLWLSYFVTPPNSDYANNDFILIIKYLALIYIRIYVPCRYVLLFSLLLYNYCFEPSEGFAE